MRFDVKFFVVLSFVFVFLSPLVADATGISANPTSGTDGHFDITDVGDFAFDCYTPAGAYDSTRSCNVAGAGGGSYPGIVLPAASYGVWNILQFAGGECTSSYASCVGSSIASATYTYNAPASSNWDESGQVFGTTTQVVDDPTQDEFNGDILFLVVMAFMVWLFKKK